MVKARAQAGSSRSLRASGEIHALNLDSKPPLLPIKDYVYSETRFKMLTLSKPAEADRLLKLAQEDVKARYQYYQQLAGLKYEASSKE